MEKSIQQKLINFLKTNGCYVIKTRPGPGVPVGCPDIIALYRGFWIALEVKASEKAKLGPLQLKTSERLSKMGYTRFVYPANYEQIISELENLLR
jgi:Holliday junction resolvase